MRYIVGIEAANGTRRYGMNCDVEEKGNTRTITFPVNIAIRQGEVMTLEECHVPDGPYWLDYFTFVNVFGNVVYTSEAGEVMRNGEVGVDIEAARLSPREVK
jgi:hypothetical protein